MELMMPTVRTYGLCLSAGLLAALPWLAARCRDLKKNTALWLSLTALPLAFLLSRLAQCAVSQGWYLFRQDFFFNFRRGGYMLYGAMAGAVLAARITARLTRQDTGRLLDALAVPGMLLISVCRFAEGLIGVGYGRDMADWFDPWNEYVFFPMEDPEPLMRFPFGIPDYYGVYRFSVFLLEGLAAAVFLVILCRKKAAAPGGLFLLALILYAGAQTTLESLRDDSLPRWGFVRVNQILSGAALVTAMALSTARLLKRGEPGAGKAAALRWAGLLACMGVILAMEFAVEGKIHFLLWMRMDLCYFVMGLSSLGLILFSASLWKKAWQNETAPAEVR